MTVVFSDLKGSTALGEILDSESLREVMTRYFDEFRRVLERPRRDGREVHRRRCDGRLRAPAPARGRCAARRTCRARHAGGTRAAEPGAAGRLGCSARQSHRGEHRRGRCRRRSTGQRLVTGDTVNVAARLEQVAPENEILIGEPTYRLVKDAVSVEQVAPLALKGKSEGVPAYRLLGVAEGCSGRRPAEQTRRWWAASRSCDAMRDAFGRAVRERRCELVTILGTPGCREVTPDPRVRDLGGRQDRRVARTLPFLRRGNHLLGAGGGLGAGHRGRRPARPRSAAGQARRSWSAPTRRRRRARRGGDGSLARTSRAGRDLLGSPTTPGNRRRAPPADRGLRRHPLGRTVLARPHRARVRQRRGRTDHAGLPGPEGAAGRAAGVGRRQAERDQIRWSRSRLRGRTDRREPAR